MIPEASHRDVTLIRGIIFWIGMPLTVLRQFGRAFLSFSNPSWVLSDEEKLGRSLSQQNAGRFHNAVSGQIGLRY